MSQFTSEEKIALIQLLQIDGLGVNKVREIVNYLSSAIKAFEADIVELTKIEGINTTLAKRIINESIHKNNRSFAEAQILTCEKLNYKLITYWDEEYPYYLRKIYDPPVIFFATNDFEFDGENSLAVVGTRNPTNYGKNVTEKFVSELVQYGFVIISGLARGIDTIAHITAIKNNGKTIAVLGSGLDIIYPGENKKLFHSIIDNGVVISEYFFGTKPDAMNFPRRNRIISGLSRAVLIVETDINGGAIITANFALDQNRDVFAIPGNIDIKQSRGTNYLIQTGQAKLVFTVDNILEDFGNKFLSTRNYISNVDLSELNVFESKIYAALGNDSLHIDEIAEKTQLSVSECLVHLLSLEFRGLIKQLPGKFFSRT